MKKKVVLLFLLILSTNLFAFDLKNMVLTGSFFDSSFISMLTEFYSYGDFFYNLIKNVGTVFALIGIFWHCMKVLIGTEETKKAIVDPIVKMLLYVVLLNFYPTVVKDVLNFSHTIGMSKCISQMNITFAEVKNIMEQSINQAQTDLINNIVAGYKYEGISKDEIKKLADQIGVYNDELYEKIKAAAQNNEIIIYGSDGKKDVGGQSEQTLQELKKIKEYQKKSTITNVVGFAVAGPIGVAVARKVAINKTDQEGKELALAAKAAQKEAARAFERTLSNGISYKGAVARLEALAAVCFTNPGLASTDTKKQEELKDSIEAAKKNLKPIHIDALFTLNPYISDGSGGFVLSPASILKTAILVTSFTNINTKGMMEMFDNSDENSQKIEKKETTLLQWTYDHILGFIITFIINIGICTCAIYFCIQYIMCLLEYYIVFAIGYLLLPLLLWEVTANYTKGLLKLVVSYFLKILVMCIAIGFAWNQFLNLTSFIIKPGVNEMCISNPFTLILNVAFTLLIALAFVGEAPKIAQVILTGNPDMSMGEFMKQAGVAVGASAKAAKAVNTGGKAVGGAAKLAGRGVVGGATTLIGAGVANKFKSDEIKKAKASGDQGAIQKAKSMKGGLSFVADSAKSAISNKAATMLGLNPSNQEYKNGQWQQRGPTSSKGFKALKEDKENMARARADQFKSDEGPKSSSKQDNSPKSQNAGNVLNKQPDRN